MPRGITTLEEVVANIRKGSYRSPDRNFGKDEYSSIAYLAARVQNGLFWDHDWQFLKARRTVTLAAGQRYYDMPADMDFERITRARVRYGDQWQDLVRGIDLVADYNDYDSDNDVRADPAYKWDIINTVTAGDNPTIEEQLEFWPMPASVSQVNFDGILKLAPFTADNHKCTLDNTLIELFAQAELLAGDERADAPAKLAAANRLYARMKGGASRITPQNKISMIGAPERAPRRSRIIPVYAGSS